MSPSRPDTRPIDEGGRFPMQETTDQQTIDQLAQNAVTVLTSHLHSDQQQRVLTEIFTAIYAYRADHDVSKLTAMADDVAFTMRMQRSETYRSLVDKAPRRASDKGRPVGQVLTDLDL
jgi:hypothetical protein